MNRLSSLSAHSAKVNRERCNTFGLGLVEMGMPKKVGNWLLRSFKQKLSGLELAP